MLFGETIVANSTQLVKIGGSNYYIEIDSDILFVPSSFFKNGNQIYDDNESDTKAEDAYEKLLKDDSSGRCVVHEEIDDIKIEWDFNNPNLGKWYIEGIIPININKNDIEINLIIDMVHNKKCGRFFKGEISWEISVKAIRKWWGTYSMKRWGKKSEIVQKGHEKIKGVKYLNTEKTGRALKNVKKEFKNMRPQGIYDTDLDDEDDFYKGGGSIDISFLVNAAINGDIYE